MSTVLTLALVARAEPFGGAEAPPLNAQVFHPSVGGERMLWTEEVGGREDPVVHAGFLFQYANDPLAWTGEHGRDVELLSDVGELDGMLEGKLGRIRLGLSVPVYALARGATSDGLQSGSALGDIGVSGKIVLLDQGTGPFGLALSGGAALPTATTELSLGSEEIEAEGVIAIAKEVGRVLLAGNVGALDGPDLRLGEDLHVNDFVLARIGVSVAATAHTGFALETTGRAALKQAITSDANDAEWLASGYFRVSPGAQLRVGGGSGLTPGIGSPDYRVVAGVSFAPETAGAPEFSASAKPEPNAVEDGVADANCPMEGLPPGMDVELRFVDEAHTPLATTTTHIDGVADECGHGLKTEHEIVVHPENREAPVAFQKDVDLGGTKVSVDLTLSPDPNSKITVTKDHIALKEEVHFQTASAVILPDSYDLLDQVAMALAQYPEIRHLRIEGHCDERGSDAYNQALSEARAESVRDYLVAKGIDGARLTTLGLGEMLPVARGETEEAWAQNRRVELFIEEWGTSTAAR